MIPLEKQVCSLDLAKRLKELGVKQESLFYWHIDSMKEFDPRVKMGLPSGDVATYGISAFTVAELGERLPKEAVSSWRYFPDGTDAPEGWRWKCYYQDDDIARVWADTEADCRAKM
jgi:hypothetical protein